MKNRTGTAFEGIAESFICEVNQRKGSKNSTGTDVKYVTQCANCEAIQEGGNGENSERKATCKPTVFCLVCNLLRVLLRVAALVFMFGCKSNISLCVQAGEIFGGKI